MKTLIAPSLLASDWNNLESEIKAAEISGADYLHLDVMDGHFVPEITFGANFTSFVKKVSSIPLDVHLMIEKPELHIESFKKAGADIITVHAEACPHLHRVLQSIRELGIKAGVAYNPGTNIDSLKEVIELTDLVCLMTVNPGWGGQKFIETTLTKIQAAREIITSSKREIHLEVDGGINSETAKKATAAGANFLVAGSSVFLKNDGTEKPYEKAIADLRD